MQLVLGGLLTFDLIGAVFHILTGFVVFMLALATMIFSLVSKPKSRSLQSTSILLVVLIMVQMILGFDTLGTGSQVIAWIHFVNAMAIYGIAISGAFVSSIWDRTSQVQTVVKETGRV